MSDTPHFRIVMPTQRGQLQLARSAQVFVKLPGILEELELTTVRSITNTMSVDDVPIVRVTFMGTMETQYGD